MILGDDDMNHLKFNTDDDDETISIMGPPGGPYTLSVDREDLIVAEEEVGEKKDITLGSSADIPWLEVWINNTDGGRRRRKTKKSKRQRQRGGIPPPGGEPRLTIAIPRPQVPGPRAESGAQAPRPRGGRKTRRRHR